MILHSVERGPGVLALFRELTVQAPETLSCLLVMRRAPSLPLVPQQFHGEPVAGIAVCDSGPGSDGEEVARRLRAMGDPAVDPIGRKPFRALQQMLDGGQPFGRRYYWKSEYLAGIAPQSDDTILSHVGRITSPHSAVLCMTLGGAVGRPPEDTAAGNREAGCIFVVQSAWEDRAEDAAHVGWARSFHADIQPWSTGGTYVNFLTEDELAGRMQAAYGSALHRRLAEAKSRFDPDNFFRSGHNIAPARARAS